MGAILDFRDIMRQTVTVERYIGPNEYGGGHYRNPESLRARVERKPRRILGNDRQELLAMATVFIDPQGTEVDPKDRLTLEDGKTAPIIGIETHYDEKGVVYHQQISVGSTQ